MKSNLPIDPPAQKPLRHYLLQIGLYLAIALLLLVPTYIAIGSYIFTKNAPEDKHQSSYISMTLSGPRGGEAAASKDSQESLLRLFSALIDDSALSFGVPETHKSGAYTVTMQSSTQTDTYQFYFSTSSANCYYSATNGTVYQSENEAVEAFLNSSFAYELYASTELPTLTTY